MILNLSNFIHGLLLENETVIIPGFGAFISTYKPAEIKENEIIPPSKEISFTQQIKNNDGLLVEIIARKAKISQTNALKRVEKARENMLYELDKGETVILENVGSLCYNEQNEIEFTPFWEDNLLLDSFGLETISTEDVAERIVESESPEPVITEITEHIFQTVPVPETEKVLETVQKPEPEKFKYPEFKQAERIEEKEERKKMGWYWYLLILIPIFIGGYFVVTYYLKSGKTEIAQEQIREVEQQKMQIPIVLPRDSMQNDSVIVTKPDTKVNTAAEPAVQNETSKYYLIGGGFREEENVDEYMMQLKEKGIESFVAGKKGSLILVGIESFDTEAEATKSLNEHFKTNPDWKLWIFKKE